MPTTALCYLVKYSLIYSQHIRKNVKSRAPSIAGCPRLSGAGRLVLRCYHTLRSPPLRPLALSKGEPLPRNKKLIRGKCGGIFPVFDYIAVSVVKPKASANRRLDKVSARRFTAFLLILYGARFSLPKGNNRAVAFFPPSKAVAFSVLQESMQRYARQSLGSPAPLVAG